MNNNINIITKREQRNHLFVGFYKAIVLLVGFLIILASTPQNAEAADKKYGIMIADKNDSYTFYDMNQSEPDKAGLEINESGSVMVPIDKLSSLIPVLVFRYDAKKKTVVLMNKENNHKVIYKMGNKKYTYYSSTKAKAVTKTMESPMYRSKINKSFMVSTSSLQWVMKKKSGYHYFDQAKMQGLGYDTMIYSGMIVYHPHQAVTALPKATLVKGIEKTVKITIPEGYSVPQIFNLLVRKGVCTSIDALYDSMEHYDFSYYPLVAELKDNQNRCYKLEGYLYPDTYNFYILSKSQDVIGKFMRNAEAKITKTDRDKAKSLGYSINDVLIIASLIEKETGDVNLMPQIASVIFNRLKIGMKLQFDSSIYYVERYIKPNISGDSNRYNAYYNTYKTAALPAGPICNPGKDAIAAALNPAISDYLFFYSDTEGVYHFSKELQK